MPVWQAVVALQYVDLIPNRRFVYQYVSMDVSLLIIPRVNLLNQPLSFYPRSSAFGFEPYWVIWIDIALALLRPVWPVSISCPHSAYSCLREIRHNGTSRTPALASGAYVYWVPGQRQEGGLTSYAPRGVWHEPMYGTLNSYGSRHWPRCTKEKTMLF